MPVLRYFPKSCVTPWPTSSLYVRLLFEVEHPHPNVYCNLLGRILSIIQPGGRSIAHNFHRSWDYGIVHPYVGPKNSSFECGETGFVIWSKFRWQPTTVPRFYHRIYHRRLLFSILDRWKFLSLYTTLWFGAEDTIQSAMVVVRGD